MPVIEEVEDNGTGHTRVDMGPAARLQAFADAGGAAECGAGQDVGAVGAGPGAEGAAQGTAAGGGASEGAEQAGNENVGKELTEEEKMQEQQMLAGAQALKAEGNALFGAHEYDAAIQKYTEAIETAPTGHKEQAVFFNNRATCYFKQGNYSLVIADCTSALRIDADYTKCLLRRAQAYETEKKVCEAFDDYERILKLEPGNSMAAAGSKRLKPAAEAERERMKEEMMGKLKDLGNTVLGKFGLSLDNFKATQDPSTGGYSISFQQNP